MIITTTKSGPIHVDEVVEPLICRVVITSINNLCIIVAWCSGAGHPRPMSGTGKVGIKFMSISILMLCNNNDMVYRSSDEARDN